MRGWGMPSRSARRTVSDLALARSIASGRDTSTGTPKRSAPAAIAPTSAEDCGNTTSTRSCSATSSNASR